MDSTLIRELMLETITEARKSRSEDGRDDHPYVGAILADGSTGRIILRSHRGEPSDITGLPVGAHAEYVLLEKAKRQNVS
jgi:tRNA(Arg) A34 adenosine deaminase TadA